MRRSLPVALSLLGALGAQGNPETVLQGRVVDVLGDPVPAATVAAIAHGVTVARTTTDGEGVYHLSRVPARGAEIRFTAPGKAEVCVPWRGPGAPHFRNETLEDADRLYGRVTNAAGGAVAGATVIVVADRFHGEAVTDAGGRYELAAVPLRAVLVRAWAATGRAERAVRLVGTTRCDISMPARTPGTRCVRVKGLPAEAVATARVEMTSSDLALLTNRGRVPLRADSTAEVTPTECCLVHLVAPGFDATPAGYLLTAGDAPIEFEVAPFTCTTILKGRVVDGHSRPIAGYRLAARDRSSCDLGSVVIGADGHFTLPVPIQSRAFCRLGLELSGWQLVGETMAIADGFSWVSVTADPQALVDLCVEPTCELRTELRGRGGAWLVLAEVVIADAEQPHKAFVRAISDRMGNVEVHLPVGDYELFATGNDGQIARADVRVAASRGAAAVPWQVLPSGTIEGQVLDVEGQPMPGIELYLAAQELQGATMEHASSRLSCRVLTDRNGRFRGRGLSPGMWTVVAPEQPGIEGAGEIARDATTNVVLRLRR